MGMIYSIVNVCTFKIRVFEVSSLKLACLLCILTNEISLQPLPKSCFYPHFYSCYRSGMP